MTELSKYASAVFWWNLMPNHQNSFFRIPSSQSRQLLASINVSHSPVPVLLTHTEFQKLFVLKDHDTVHMKKAPTLCPLERFFGSVMLRAHLLRVLRTDETVIFVYFFKEKEGKACNAWKKDLSKWVKVFKNWPSKICGRQPLKKIQVIRIYTIS